MIFDDYALGPDWKPYVRPATAIDAFLDIYRDTLEVLHKSGSIVIVRKVYAKKGMSLK